MPKKSFVPQKEQAWIDARKRYHLSHAQIQMARELGLNPKTFGALANHDQEPWKDPLPVFIERIYFKRFGKAQPDTVRSVEQNLAAQREKKEARRRERESAAAQPASDVTAQDPESGAGVMASGEAKEDDSGPWAEE